MANLKEGKYNSSIVPAITTLFAKNNKITYNKRMPRNLSVNFSNNIAV